MTERPVNFQDKQGRNIVGTLLTPDGQGSFAAVILCHGFKGSKDQVHIKKIGEDITKTGLALFRFDFTSEPGESSLPFEDMTISYELEVLDEAIKFLEKQIEINKEKIGLAGHSLGGLVIAWYASQNPNITSIATLSAVYNFPIMWNHTYGEEMTKEMKEKGFGYVFSRYLNKKLRIKIGFYDDAQKYDMDEVIDTLTCPILVIAGTGDTSVTLEHAQHYFDKAESQIKQLEIIKGSDHNYSDPKNLDEVATTVANWFEKTLK